MIRHPSETGTGTLSDDADAQDAELREPTRHEYLLVLDSAPEIVRWVFNAEFEIASRALAGERSPQALAQLFLGTAIRVADAVARFDLPVACGAGCSWCCRGTKVEVLAPEALAIAEVLRHAASDDGSERELEAALAARAAEVRTLNVAERWRQQIPCAFLEEDTGRCTVYPVRPLACRHHHAVDASECERALRDATGEQHTRSHTILDAIWSAARAAVRYACTEAGLDDRGFELTNAVGVAMKEPDAQGRWARGERLFDGAKLASDAEDRKRAMRAAHESRTLISEQSLLRKPPSKADRNKLKRARKERK